MFDIGFWEMLVIGVMALLILGPERLPGAMRSTISTIRSIKDMANGFKQEVSSQLDAHELHANLKKAENLGMENIGQELRDSVNELKAAAASVQQPYKSNKIQADVTSADKPQSSTPTSDSNNTAKEISPTLKTSTENEKLSERKPSDE